MIVKKPAPILFPTNTQTLQYDSTNGMKDIDCINRPSTGWCMNWQTLISSATILNESEATENLQEGGKIWGRRSLTIDERRDTDKAYSILINSFVLHHERTKHDALELCQILRCAPSQIKTPYLAPYLGLEKLSDLNQRDLCSFSIRISVHTRRDAGECLSSQERVKSEPGHGAEISEHTIDFKLCSTATSRLFR